MKKTILILSSFLVLFMPISCAINGTFQGLYSYYKKTKKTNPGLLVENYDSNSLCSLSENDIGKIYIINGIELKKCVVNTDNALIYIWGPKCNSPICYPLNLLQEICNENKIELYIVAEYYDAKLMNIKYNIKKPIFGINTNYYKTNLTDKYLPKFIQEITSSNMTIENRFLYYQGGKFINSFYSVEKLIREITKEDNVIWID